jgi:hypothetical protein
VRQARTGRNMLKCSSPNAPSIWFLFLWPRTHAKTLESLSYVRERVRKYTVNLRCSVRVCTCMLHECFVVIAFVTRTCITLGYGGDTVFIPVSIGLLSETHKYFRTYTASYLIQIETWNSTPVITFKYRAVQFVCLYISFASRLLWVPSLDSNRYLCVR